MRVLVGCEFSAVVRDAFRARGHQAWSCDLLPCEGDPRWHYQADVFDVIDLLGGFDLLVAFPPCTHLAASGAAYWPQKAADGRQAEAIAFFMRLLNCANIPRRAIENPVGLIGSRYEKAAQIIQPWQYGEPYNKKTCLWLRNLPPLRPTNIVTPTHNWTDGSYRSGTRKLSPLPSLHRDPHKRSKSFAGFAAAMADQWGVL